MRLIDVLNKIANGELKEGTEIKIVNGSDYFTYRTNNEEDETFHELLDKDGQNIFAGYYMEVLEDEVELIEPQEPTECEHEWVNYGRYNPDTGETKDFRKCAKCDLEEDIEPTDNTTEKIEELKTYENSVMDIFYKLNEVIRKINKEN